MDQLLTGEALASLLTLTALEIVLGIDNIIFLSIISSRVTKSRQAAARKFGLLFALAGRITFLSSITWLMHLEEPVASLGSFDLSWHDVIMFAGGGFLVYKAVTEIHASLQGLEEGEGHAKNLSFTSAILQIALLDVVFALDSMITAVGLSDFLSIMIAANVIAMFIMLFASNSVSNFIEAHPSLKMLALSFLLMVGVALMAEGMHFHIPRDYIYFSLAFSAATECLNIVAHKKREKRKRKNGSS